MKVDDLVKIAAASFIISLVYFSVFIFPARVYESEDPSATSFQVRTNFNRVRSAGNVPLFIATNEPHVVKTVNLSVPAKPPIVQTSKVSESLLKYKKKVETAKHALCVLIAFRETYDANNQGAGREENLKELVPLLRKHLDANLPKDTVYGFVVSEQTPGLLFNKGALFNAAFAETQSMGICDYYSFHDVDQVPASAKNTYEYSDFPVHQCTYPTQEGWDSSISLREDAPAGGALLMNVESYKKINGYSNSLWGWGREDDDIAHRIKRHLNAWPRRLPRGPGDYRALHHPRVRGLDLTSQFSANMKLSLAGASGTHNYLTDGFNNVQYKVVNQTWVDEDLLRIKFDVLNRENLVQ